MSIRLLYHLEHAGHPVADILQQSCEIVLRNVRNEVLFMPREASRTASVYARVDSETKEQAERVLMQLGIPMSNAIGMFLEQIVIRRGIPFDLKLPAARPDEISDLTKEQIDAELQLGMDDIRAGRVVSADEVEAEMRRMYR